MFSYYGSKSKIIRLYPKPKHNLIIEPFAGSARYALEYWERDVILIDKFHKIIKIWNYLKQASVNDILSLPDISIEKEKIPKTLSLPEQWLIGFCVGGGSPRPATMAHKYNNWKQDKIKIANNLSKIRHWNFIQGDYHCVKNVEATWYIDPPYIDGGHKYNFSNKHIDFASLSDWSKERNGQVIVCENGDADWLPFIRLGKLNGTFNCKAEVFWTNEKLEYQTTLF